MTRTCPNCRGVMRQVDRIDWGTEPPLVDEAEYLSWRCSACGCEVKAKPDGTHTRDSRYTERRGT